MLAILSQEITLYQTCFFAGTDITSLSNTIALHLYNEALKDEVIKIKRTRSHSFLKDQMEQQQQQQKHTTTSIDITDKVLKESKEAPRPVPKLSDDNDGQPPREAAIEAPTTAITSSVAKTTTSEGGLPSDNKRHVFSIELIKGMMTFFNIKALFLIIL